MKKRMICSILLVALLLAVCSIPALATGYQIETLQSDNPEYGFSYVPPNVHIRKMRLPLVEPEKWAVLYVAPTDDANYITVQPNGYIMRYLGMEGDFYKALTFENKVVYIKKSDAARSTKTVDFVRYPEGTYVVGRTITVKEAQEKTDLDTGTTSVSVGEYITRPWSEKVLAGNRYYVKPYPGEKATVVISNDEAGKDVVKKLETTGEIIWANDGQYVSIQNGYLYDFHLAPSAAIEKDIADNPTFYSPGDGYVYDPNMDFGWNEDLRIIAFC